jgi:predicted oxidoreductase
MDNSLDSSPLSKEELEALLIDLPDILHDLEQLAEANILNQ